MLPEHPRLLPDTTIQQQGDLFLLLSPARGTWCVVDALGCRLAQSCTGEVSWRDLARDLARRYAVTVQRAEQDVSRYLQQLQRAGLLLDERPTPAPECRPREETAVRLRVTLHTTPGCNLTCRHCFQSPASEGVLQGRPVPFPVLQARLDQCQAAGAVSVVLTGGEILTHPQWRSIVSAATARFEVTVVTNGTLVSEEAADFLADAGVHVQVSLDGPDAETHDALRGPGAYARTMAGIQRLLDRGVGPRMTWSTCVNRHNLAHISTLAQQAFTLGVGRLYLIWLAPRGCAVGNWEQLSTFAEERVALVRALRPLLRAHHERIVVAGCGDPRETTCPLEAGECALIDVDGSVYPCILLADARYRLGNTEAEGLAAALASPAARQLRALVPARVERIAECRACEWRRYCRASCPGLAWLHQADWWQHDDLCAVRREYYAQTLFGWAEERRQASPVARES